MTAASRRSVLTGTSEPDPIFALIDAAKMALKAHEDALEIQAVIEEDSM